VNEKYQLYYYWNHGMCDQCGAPILILNEALSYEGNDQQELQAFLDEHAECRYFSNKDEQKNFEEIGGTLRAHPKKPVIPADHCPRSLMPHLKSVLVLHTDRTCHDSNNNKADISHSRVLPSLCIFRTVFHSHQYQFFHRLKKSFIICIGALSRPLYMILLAAPPRFFV
jgi:hypothetical protein